MSPITASYSHFSNSAELLRLRDEIFPTAEVGSLFKFNQQSHLQSPLFHSLIIHTDDRHIVPAHRPRILAEGDSSCAHAPKLLGSYYAALRWP